ncbi:MAG: 50S ribosomal protein L9 [Tissierellia bacterium]|nr:50S ribosomal protein L9 [Tissierellia bacterium]
MKVILIEDVNKIGKKGEMVNVKQGYFRNYLKANNLAIEANKENTKKWEEEQEKKRQLENENRQKALELKSKLEDIVVNVKAKTGEDGKLFGSITNKDINQALKKQENIDVDKKKINLIENIKQTGNFVVEVKVYPEIQAQLKVNVEAK